MILNPTAQHRLKYINQSFARELSLIERKHSQNLHSHQKLENSIRRACNQTLSNNRAKVCIPFDNIYNEQTDSIDYNKIRTNDQMSTHNLNSRMNSSSNLKRRVSIGGSSIMSQNPVHTDSIDEFSDDTASFISVRRRRFCTKAQRLPPIVKASISTRQKRDPKNHWTTNTPQSNNKSRDNGHEKLPMLYDESTKSIKVELTPIQRQVRSFLETLPTYKGVQRGFDSFGPASLYTNRAPVVIR